MGLITYAVVGRIVVWALQTSDLFTWFRRQYWLIQSLFECDFCLGCWVYFGLAYVSGLELYFTQYPLINAALTAIVTSFVAHLAALGWKVKWGVFKMD
jgi:hypothetical protein